MYERERDSERERERERESNGENKKKNTILKFIAYFKQRSFDF